MVFIVRHCFYHNRHLFCASSTSMCSGRFIHRKIPEFEIPISIERTQTDILRALANTVEADETAAHFSYIDDPFTIPTSTNHKRKYLIAREYGRRTARTLVQEWPTLFQFDRDEPRLAAFRPQKPLDPIVVEANEDNLSRMIESKQVCNAINLYEKICSSGEDVSETTKLDFFRLICFYNEKDVPLSEIDEWHSTRDDTFEMGVSWKSSGLAEQLFESLKKTSETYSFLICGICKFVSSSSVQIVGGRPVQHERLEEHLLERAKYYYEKMIAEQLVPHEEVFNWMLQRQIPLEMAFNFEDWLKEMQKCRVRPTERTFNAVLNGLLYYQRMKAQNCQSDPNMEPIGEICVQKANQIAINPWDQTQKVLAEMRQHGIEPTLTTYWNTLLLVPIKHKLQVQVNMLDEILSSLELKMSRSEPIICVDSSTDSAFFREAMSIAVAAKNESLVDRIDELYKYRKNQVLFTGLSGEQSFYEDLLYFKLQTLPMPTFFIIYKKLVPQKVGFSQTLCKRILTEMKNRKPNEFCWPLLERFTEDYISSGYIRYYAFTATVLNHLNDVKPRLFSSDNWERYMTLTTRFNELIEQEEKIKETFNARKTEQDVKKRQ